MTSRIVSSWGGVIAGEHEILRMSDRFGSLPRVGEDQTLLPFGNGRSYGDSCLNVGQCLLQMRSLDRFIQFDRDQGGVLCEAGVLLEEILAVTVPSGWFLPVVPGTSKVTVGGAIANDVHGKNHHRVGTFGCHVKRLELLRSTGERLICSHDENPQWFSATIGGLGLTGVITWAELKLRRVAGSWMAVESTRFRNLDEFFALSEASNAEFEYVVAWIDCLARGNQLGRGILQRANHLDRRDGVALKKRTQFTVPFTPPFSLVNGASLRLFNLFHYHSHTRHSRRLEQPYPVFFFPLDGIQCWNRLYGPHGFYQYQCVIPVASARESAVALLQAISSSGQGSFLAVLKYCGPCISPGMLSFPREGVSLALDFPNTSARLMTLLQDLDAIVGRAGGRLYPAKDGRMPGEVFREGYPCWREFLGYIDPHCSSTFWRRVTEVQVHSRSSTTERSDLADTPSHLENSL